MQVVASPDVKVPKEGNPRAYITQDEATEVPESYYYLRRLADGDLIRLPEAVPVKAGKAASKTTASNAK
jgi:hypothetical protein